MTKGLGISCAMHVTIMLILLFGLPQLWRKNLNPVESAISVEILPISQKSNVKTKKPQLQEKKQESQELITKEKPKISMSESQVKPEIKKETKQEKQQKKENKVPPIEKAPIEKKIPDKKIEEKPKPKEEELKQKTEQKAKEEKKAEPPKKPKVDFGSVLKSVEEFSKDEPKKTDKKSEFNVDKIEDSLAAESDSEFDDSQPLSMSEKDMVKNKISDNLGVSSFYGAKNTQNITIVVNIKLNKDGSFDSILSVKDVSSGRYDKKVFEIFKNRIIESTKVSAPFDLPEDKYIGKNGWNELELTFDLETILNQRQ